MDIFPIKFEAYDDGVPVFKVEMTDEVCATVSIDIPVTVESWKEISKNVLKCLEDMKLEV